MTVADRAHPMAEKLTVSEVARRIGASPRDISDGFYRRSFPGAEDACPIQAGRRMIPIDYVAVIAAVLRRAGKLPELSNAE